MVRHNGTRVRKASLTFCDGEGDKGFTAMTVVGPRVAHETVVDPDPVRFVSGCVACIAGRQGTNVSEASVGLLMPVPSFVESHTFHIVLALPNTVVQGTVKSNGV
jgi:hypothetical protein